MAEANRCEKQMIPLEMLPQQVIIFARTCKSLWETSESTWNHETISEVIGSATPNRYEKHVIP